MWKKTSIAALALVGLLGAASANADHRYKTKHKRWHRADDYRVATYRPARRVVRSRADYDYARVVDVEPILRYVTVRVPERTCWDEEVYYDDYRSGRDGTAAATIAGGLLGGVVGRQIGGGSGRDAMTVVGTIVGSAIAREHTAQRARRYDDYAVDTVQRCETRTRVHEEERIDGYRVTYLYNGKEYTTRTARDPGDRIRVRVSVTPERY